MSDAQMDLAALRTPHNDAIGPSTLAPTTPSAPASRLGERLRSLRLAAGLTQTQVAGDRFSKEYISQIERGKTRPTPESIEWLAAKLSVDPVFLGSGVSTDLRGRIEAQLARAEALSEARRHLEAADLFAAVRVDVGEDVARHAARDVVHAESRRRVRSGRGVPVAPLRIRGRR